MMRLPKRPTTHVTEAAAWKILQANAPDNWILREVTERDYGIDAYIEIASDKGEVTGDLISVQLKGTASVKWTGKKGERRAMSPPIQTSTANYWERLPVPVFLFVADLEKKDIYFTSVEPTIRRQYGKLADQDAMTFGLAKVFSLRSKAGPALLEWMAGRERLHRDIVVHITNLVSHAREYADFIRINQNRDAHMEVEAEEHLRFRSLYQSCQIAAAYLGIDWQVESLKELYRRDHEAFNDDYCPLHELTLDYALVKIEKVFLEIIRSAVDLIANQEGEYWRRRQPILHAICSSGELNWTIRDMEQRFARG